MTPEHYISAATVAIALCALAVAIWQGYVAREHAKLSVRPHIEIHFGIRQSGALTIEVVNVGLGPGFIANVFIRFGNEEFALDGAASSRKLARALAGNVPEYNLSFFIQDNEIALSPGARLTLLELTTSDGADGPWKFDGASSIAYLQSLSGKCEYKCMYGILRQTETKGAA